MNEANKSADSMYDVQFNDLDGTWHESLYVVSTGDGLDAACERIRDLAQEGCTAYRLLQNGIILYTYDPAEERGPDTVADAPHIESFAAPSVLAEATLAAAVKVDPPRAPALPALDVPHLRVLFDQWQRHQGVTLPVDSTERKLVPIQTGHNDYFPAAIAAVAAWSAFNNNKHNPGMPLHWSQHKSSDHPDCIARHTVDMREASDKFVRFVEATARAWRAYGELQMLCQELGAPLAPGARSPEAAK